MSIVNIRRALEARLAAFTVSAPLTAAAPILWLVSGQATGNPEGDVTEPASGYWLEVRFIAETTGRVDYAGSRKDRAGTLQIAAVERKGEGASLRVMQLAEQVSAHFPKGFQLFEGGDAVKIDRDTEVTSEFFDNGRIRRPVIVRWRAFS